jgi:hypothetical protein
MSACLYVNTAGQQHFKHSYSAGLDWSQSPYKYYLRRVLGWKQRDVKASFKFGRALESAIQFYHDNGGQGGLEKFIELWSVHKEDKTVEYTKTEGSWESLNKAGQEMMRLYAIRQPSLPIPLGGASVFQREYMKMVYEGDLEYGELSFAGKLDIVAYVQPDHPFLPKVNWRPEYGMLRPLIVDIKTSSVDLPERPGIVSFDKQLRVYSWLTGIRDTAFLWFKKTGHNLSKGSSVTLLEKAGIFEAGAEAVVAQVVEDKVYLVANDFVLEQMTTAQGRKEDGAIDQTKAAKERKAKWLSENAVLVPQSAVTRQRLQFNCGFVSVESANDAGLIAAKQIIEIANAWKSKQYPQNFGIRFPQDDQRDPYFRAFVLKDEAFKNENFEQADSGSDDLFDDEPEDEDD